MLRLESNNMEFAKAVATQLPQVTVDHELVFQFYRVCSEVHNCTLSATPKLLQHAGAAAPCYQVGGRPPGFFEWLSSLNSSNSVGMGCLSHEGFSCRASCLEVSYVLVGGLLTFAFLLVLVWVGGMVIFSSEVLRALFLLKFQVA